MREVQAALEGGSSSSTPALQDGNNGVDDTVSGPEAIQLQLPTMTNGQHGAADTVSDSVVIQIRIQTITGESLYAGPVPACEKVQSLYCASWCSRFTFPVGSLRHAPNRMYISAIQYEGELLDTSLCLAEVSVQMA